MAENCKIYNLESFTDEERERVEALINQIEEEKKNKQKWWIVPKYRVFSEEAQELGQSYTVEPQKDIYNRGKPPLKSDFNSKEEAEKWLNNYLEEEKLFKVARDELNNLIRNLGYVVEKLQRHEYISNEYWENCFARFNESKGHGYLMLVTR